MPDATTNSARSAILGAIRKANGGAPAAGGRQSEWERLPRDYVRDGRLDPTAAVELFEHRLIEYDASVLHTDLAGIAGVIHDRLSQRNKTRMLIPTGLPESWLPAGIEFVRDDALSFGTIDRLDGILTAATVAVAVTGSIALQHGPGQGRRAISLIPDYHLCVVFTGQVVETVPQAFARLDPVQPMTFISGPSATADIEMTRIKGVHGPRFLDVVLVGE